MSTTIRVKLDERARKDRENWVRDTLNGDTLSSITYWSQVSAGTKGLWCVHIPDPDPSDNIDGFLIGEGFAARAFDLMVGLYGMHWYGKADATKYDEAIQLAAFGKRVFA